MPAFWGYPPPPHDYPYYWVILDPKSKEDKVKVTNLNNLPKFLNFETNFTHDTPSEAVQIRCANTNIVEYTERTRFCPQRDRQTRWNQYTPPFNFVEAGSIKSLENSAEAGNQGDLTNGPHFWMF